MQRIFLLLLCCLSLSAVNAQAPPPQQIEQRIFKSGQNKASTLVYLQISKGIFERGEDVWFKAYVMDAQSLAPTIRDTTLYIQLRSADGAQVLAEEKLLIENGFTNGHISIKNTTAPGDYQLAAFTTHSFLKDTGEFKAFRRLKIASGTSNAVAAVAETNDSTNIGFFPEGGNLVSGLVNTVAYKAVTADRRPVKANATLLEDGLPLMTSSGNHQGMGGFQFTPKPSADYTVRIAPSGHSYQLPKALPSGIVLRLLRQSENQFTFLLTKTRDSRYGQVYVSAQSRGVVYALYQGKMTGDSLQFNLPAAKLPPGITEVTVYDEAAQPLAERLVYVHSNQNLAVGAALSQTTFRPKDKVKVNIKVTDPAGVPVAAHLGVSVYDGFYQHPGDRLNIVSYAHLHSQIRGSITDPDYYFNPVNKDRAQAMDLLLLTQGWRRYVWTTTEPAGAAEVALPNRMSGHVESKSGLPAMLLAFSPDGAGIQNPVPVLSDGSFMLSIENMLLGNFYLKPLGLGDEPRSAVAKVMLDDPFAQIRSAVTSKNIISPVFTTEVSATSYRSGMSRSIVLDEFVVTGKGKTYSDKYMESLDSLAKFSWNTDFVGECNWLNCISCGRGKKPVEGITYSKFKDGRPSQHGSFNPNDVVKEPYKYPVYTEEELLAKFNLYRARGYQAQKQFYQPDYGHAPLEKTIDDQRNTLVWNPAVITNEKGEASIEFYCSDITGAFIGNIEGVDANGRLASLIFHFTVSEDAGK